MYENLTIIRLSTDYNFKNFDCGDADLNDFFLNDSLNYQNQLLAVTYVVEDNFKNEIVAFFSLLHDKISINDLPSNNQRKKNFKDLMPAGKRFSSYPAVKIGRLGINNSYQNKGIGSFLMDFIKGSYVEDSDAGCRFITIDAYRQSLPYYEKNQFKYLTPLDSTEETRAMYFDLFTIVENTE
jgi:GNAT superfamily N-acetyltransferase